MRLRTLIAILPIFVVPVFAAAGADRPGADNASDTQIARDSTTFDDLVRQGRAAFLASDLDRAESAYSQACPVGLADSYPVTRLATCENLLASVDEARGNLARAEQRYVHAVSVAEQAGPAYQSLYCAKLIDLGEHYHRQGKTADAESTLLKAVDLARKLTRVKPELLPEGLARLGKLYSESANPERGRAPLTEALAIVGASGGEGRAKPPANEIAYMHNALGMINLSAGRQHEAESGLRESVALATVALGEDHPVTAAYQTNLAVILIAERQYERASLLLRRAEFVVRQGKGADGSQYAVICVQMSAALSGESKWAPAEEYALRAISILGEQPLPNAQSIAMARVTLAGVYVHTGDLAAAEKILPAAIETERMTGLNSRTLAEAIQLFAELRGRQHNWHAADVLYREAIGLCEKEGATATAAAPLLLALADVLKHEGAPREQVRALESQARTILRSGSQSAPRV